MSSDDESAQSGPAARERPNWHDDILPVLRETDDPLTAAYIAVLWDSGTRSSEVASLTVDDITRDGLRYEVKIGGQRDHRHRRDRGGSPTSRRVARDS